MIEDFLTEHETNELRLAGLELCKNAPEKDRKVFHASVVEADRAHLKENYFIESATKVHYFYESGALDEVGNLQVEPEQALNKVIGIVRIFCISIEKREFFAIPIL